MHMNRFIGSTKVKSELKWRILVKTGPKWPILIKKIFQDTKFIRLNDLITILKIAWAVIPIGNHEN